MRRDYHQFAASTHAAAGVDLAQAPPIIWSLCVSADMLVCVFMPPAPHGVVLTYIP